MLIVDCRNLIGDTIYLIKPLRQFLASIDPKDVAIGVGSGLPAEIVRRSFEHIRVDNISALKADCPDAEWITLSANAAWRQTSCDQGHISQGYARVLGIELTGGIEPCLDWLPRGGAKERPEHIAVAPFSISCARHRGEPPNKTLDDEEWRPLLDTLRGYGLPLRVVGGPSERFATGLGFTEADYFTARTIEDLLAFLRRSALVVGIDTGICHVSSCAGIPTIVLWPSAVRLGFIGETWAARTRILPIGSPARFDQRRVGCLLREACAELLGQPNRDRDARPTGPECPAPADERHTAGPLFPELDSTTFTPIWRAREGEPRWSGHLPFARDLAASLRPRILVELGTECGESYFGFCQTVKEAGRPCRCYAVEAGKKSPADAVQQRNVERHNAELYGSFSELLQTSFDEAASWFADDSIDLLHIAGAKTYEEARRVFEDWSPKVVPGGVILLDNITKRYDGFGLWRLWREIAGREESFSFEHSHGLGVIRKAGSGARGGILDYLFVPENAAALRRYYSVCAERLERLTAMAQTDAPSLEARAIYVDPSPRVVEALTAPCVPGSREGATFPLPFTDAVSLRTDWIPVEGMPQTWAASSHDPQVICPAGFEASTTRFFVLAIACQSDAPSPRAQLFWSAPNRIGFSERLSVYIPLIADGETHVYVVDLHAGAGLGAVNHLWWHHGTIENVRFDPLDAPGQFTITLAGFAHQDRAEGTGVREAIGLPPLRAELSNRYLLGSGIEIGALHNPLAVRPDTHVTYVDRLTVEEARALFPELRGQAVVDPDVVCDAAALSPISDGSVDFVVANHVLEHLRDPLAAVAEWLRVMRPGGHLYVAVTDHANPLDRLRPVTKVEHMVADFQDRSHRAEFDRAHYREWVDSAYSSFPEDERARREEELIAQGYDIHFHTFDDNSFAGLLEIAGALFPAQLIELRRAHGSPSDEHIAILRKR